MERISNLSYGLTVRLQLPAIPPRGDAVIFGYGVMAFSDTDFHRTDKVPSQAHRSHAERGNEKPREKRKPYPGKPDFPLKISIHGISLILSILKQQGHLLRCSLLSSPLDQNSGRHWEPEKRYCTHTGNPHPQNLCCILYTSVCTFK